MAILASRIILTTDQLSAIGSVAVESTYLERHIETLTWKLSGLKEEYGKFLTNRMMMDGRLELLANIAKTKIASKKRKAEFIKLISDLKIANNERNIIIHGVWLFPKNPIFALSQLKNASLITNSQATRRRLNSPPETFEAKKISQTAETLSELNGKLFNFVTKQWPRLALPRTSKLPKNVPTQNQTRSSKPKRPLAP